MAKQAVAHSADLEPIDRLEDKIKLLLEMLTQMRAEHARSSEANARMAEEIQALRARLAEAEVVSTELAALRDERETVRMRVADMLQQLEAI
jgi:regulator of replication initiation timing